MSKQTCYASKLWVKLLPLPSLNTVLNINITNNFWEGIRNRHSHINHISIEGVNETMIGLEINRIGTLDFIVLHISSEDLDHPSLWWRWMTALTSAWTACPTSCSSTSSNTLMLSSSSRQSPRFSPSARAPSVACIIVYIFSWRCATFSTSWPPTRQPGGSEWPKDSQVEILCSLLPWFV